MVAGYYNANAQLCRFAALPPPSWRCRRIAKSAVSLVVPGGLLGAVAGPNLAARTRGLTAVPFADAYLAFADVALLAMTLLAFIGFPTPIAKPVAASDGGRPLSEIMRQPVLSHADRGVAPSTLPQPSCALCHIHTSTRAHAPLLRPNQYQLPNPGSTTRATPRHPERARATPSEPAPPRASPRHPEQVHATPSPPAPSRATPRHPERVRATPSEPFYTAPSPSTSRPGLISPAQASSTARATTTHQVPTFARRFASIDEPVRSGRSRRTRRAA